MQYRAEKKASRTQGCQVVGGEPNHLTKKGVIDTNPGIYYTHPSLGQSQ